MTLKAFFRNLKSLWGGAIAAATAGPLSLAITGLDPPWPGDHASSSIATLSCGVALALAYVLSSSKQTSPNRTHSVGSVFLGVGLILLLAYYGAYSMCVIGDTRTVMTEEAKEHEEQTLRWVKGNERLSSIQERYPLAYDDLKLLSEHGYKPELVWTKSSLTWARMVLIICYLGAFAFLTAGIALVAQRDI